MFSTLFVSASVSVATESTKIGAILPNGAEEFSSQSVGSGNGIETYSAPDLSALEVDDRTLKKMKSTALINSCTRWWLHGKHRYSWRWYGIYGWNKISASSQTTYANKNGSCGIPLVVDQISVKGNTFKLSGSSATVNKTAYNTDYVSDSGKGHWVGNKGGRTCGASVLHKATKYGVTWKVTTRSGCGK
jgi:hypothetical protein